VLDTCPYVEDGGELNDNFLYKKWCEETFDNGNHIYEAYKNIAFNIKYIHEPPKTDFWQTPLETARRKEGDCEDAVLLFFSLLPSYQKNAEIVWGWIFDKRNTVGRKHVWYQLVDHKGQQYVVEGFSKDWNGIIPMETIERIESRKSVLTIAHSAISRFASSLPKAGDNKINQPLVDSFAAMNFSNRDSGNRPFSQGIDTLLLPNMSKEISYILNKLYELFSRYERHKEGANMQISHESDMELLYSERNLRCRR
jgi:hypothetical protein